MNEFFATIEEYLDKLYAFIAKVFKMFEDISGTIAE